MIVDGYFARYKDHHPFVARIEVEFSLAGDGPLGAVQPEGEGWTGQGDIEIVPGKCLTVGLYHVMRWRSFAEY
jgi:hypothetical protein